MNWEEYDKYVEEEIGVYLLPAKIAGLHFKKLIHIRDDSRTVHDVLYREYGITYSLSQIEAEMIELQYRIEQEHTIEFEEDY